MIYLKGANYGRWYSTYPIIFLKMKLHETIMNKKTGQSLIVTSSSSQGSNNMGD